MSDPNIWELSEVQHPLPFVFSSFVFVLIPGYVRLYDQTRGRTLMDHPPCIRNNSNGNIQLLSMTTVIQHDIRTLMCGV